MLSTIAAVVLLLAFAVDCGVLTLRTVHMLQLNSYRPERYGGWMKAHKDELMKTYGWLLIASFISSKLSSRLNSAMSDTWTEVFRASESREIFCTFVMTSMRTYFVIPVGIALRFFMIAV